MTAVSYHDTVKDVQGLDWQAAGPFARLSWFALLEEAGHAPLYALARSGEEAVCLPLERTGNGLASLTNWYAFTCNPLRTARAHGHPALFHSLASDMLSRTHRIALDKLEEREASQLEAVFRMAGWSTIRTACDTNRFIDTRRLPYEQYLQDRPGRLRTTLKRKAKKVEVSIATSFSPEDWAEYEAIYAESWKPEEGDPALLRRFAEQESGLGHYRLGLARHDGIAVAAQFWTVEGGLAYIHKLAHRPSAEKLSPGTALTAALMRHVIDLDGVKQVDFGTGDDAYKRDWMEEARTRWSLICLRRDAPRNWPEIAKSRLRAFATTLVSRKPTG